MQTMNVVMTLMVVINFSVVLTIVLKAVIPLLIAVTTQPKVRFKIYTAMLVSDGNLTT